jgi:phosphate transport system substrate-binding protein
MGDSGLIKQTKVTGIKKRMESKIAICFVALCFSLSCNINDDTHSKNGDTPTSGEISIAVDETFQPLMESDVFTFESLYTTAKVNTNYTNEAAAFQLLLSDSVRLIIASRLLMPEEEAYFKKIKIFPRITKIAIDALALIVNKENPDSIISMDQLSDIFKGNIKTWDQLQKGAGDGGIQLVFDNKNSSTARHIKEKLNENKDWYNRAQLDQ